MEQGRFGKVIPALLAGGLLTLVVVAGGYWIARGTSASARDAADRYATGKKVFGAKCIQCHAIGGQSVGSTAGATEDRIQGPDLANVGASSDHTRQWLMDYVRDPQSENRLARMPKFEGKIPPGDLLALADYLASLKGI